MVQSLRSKAEAGDKAAALELAEDDELFKPHLQPEELQRENRAKIRRVDPTVNLAADGFDRWSEGMTARDSSKVYTEPLVGLLFEKWGSNAVPQLGVLWGISSQAAIEPCVAQAKLCMCMSGQHCWRPSWL